MSMAKHLITLSLATCALLSSVSGKPAVSHVFQKTPDYTISHKNFHAHVAMATPFLAAVDTEARHHQLEYPSSIEYSATSVDPYAYTEESEPEYVPEPDPEYVPEPVPVPVEEKPTLHLRPQDILPPGYVALAGMIDPPPGYQLFPKSSPYY